MFFFAEAATVFQWGWLSDRIGRRPVLLLGPLGLTFAMLKFGVSDSFWSLVWTRCFQGMFNGNIGMLYFNKARDMGFWDSWNTIGVSKTVMVEVCLARVDSMILCLSLGFLVDRRDQYWRCLCHDAPHVERWYNDCVGHIWSDIRLAVLLNEYL